MKKWEDDPALASIGGKSSSVSWADSLDSRGGNSSSGSWDQFAVNEAKFGLKSDFDEEMYTTKLDKTGKDFQERERRAERLASEILNVSL